MNIHSRTNGKPWFGVYSAGDDHVVVLRRSTLFPIEKIW